MLKQLVSIVCPKTSEARAINAIGKRCARHAASGALPLAGEP